MRLRSGFEYTFNDLLYSQFLSARSLHRGRRSVTWRRFVKSHLKGIRTVFAHRPARPESNVPELTRLMINPKSYSEAHRTKKWATQSLARRFVSPTGESSHKSQDSIGPAPFQEETPFALSFRTVPVSFWWKAKSAAYRPGLFRRVSPETDLLARLKRELFRKPGEFQILAAPMGTESVKSDWEMVYRTPSGSLDARFALDRAISCRPPCYCRVHSPGIWWRFEKTCISCLNYYTIIESGNFYSDRSSEFAKAFTGHVLFCGSELARRYRGRKMFGRAEGTVDPDSFVERDRPFYDGDVMLSK